MNEQNTKAQEQARLYMEAHDGEIKAAEQKALADDISPDLQIIYAALERINTRIFGALVVPDAPIKRQRAKTVATEAEVQIVKDALLRIASVTPRYIADIAHAAEYGVVTTRNACEQLEQQGWAKREGKRWRWIPEQEAERENGISIEEPGNGPIMIDDVKE